jgi:hypothetical protein
LKKKGEIIGNTAGMSGASKLKKSDILEHIFLVSVELVCQKTNALTKFYDENECNKKYIAI